MVAKATVPTTSQGDLSDLSLLKMPTAGETPQQTFEKSSIRSPQRPIMCGTAHFEELRGARKWRVEFARPAGSGRWLEKTRPRSYGQGSADVCGPGCGDTPTAEIDVLALVRTRCFMSSWADLCHESPCCHIRLGNRLSLFHVDTRYRRFPMLLLRNGSIQFRLYTVGGR